MSIDAILDARGLADCKKPLYDAGLMTLADLRGVTDEDLAKIGIDKFFHRRRILQLAVEQSHEALTPSQALDACGDHIRIEVVAARGTELPLTERDYYVKACLCDKVEHEIYAVEGTTQRTSRARGPTPVWDGGAVIKLKTSFRSHAVAVELKEARLIGENKLVGLLIFPMTKLHSFSSGYVEDTWFPMRSDCETTSDVTCMLRLRLSVPGGCPKQNGPAFHVKSVLMLRRKFKVTIFEALIQRPDATGTEEDPPEAPNTYVTIHLDEGNDYGAHIKAKTKIAKNSWSPAFDEGFEFSAEAGKCKLLTIKLKREVGSLFTSGELIGQVRIPVQYYMAQRRPAEVDETFPVLNDSNRLCGKLHVRLQVLPADQTAELVPPGASFRRTSSVHSTDPVDVDNHPAFSPKRAGVQQDALFVSSDTESDGAPQQQRTPTAPPPAAQPIEQRKLALDDPDDI